MIEHLADAELVLGLFEVLPVVLVVDGDELQRVLLRVRLAADV